jgi:hypothetical protein
MILHAELLLAMIRFAEQAEGDLYMPEGAKTFSDFKLWFEVRHTRLRHWNLASPLQRTACARDG